MEKRLTERQKKIVLARLRALKSKPSLLAKYDRDGDGVVSPEEWEEARQDVIRQVLSDNSSRLFEVAPILSEKTRRSGLLMWMLDYREKVSLICFLLGGIMILTDPGTFAPRGEPPGEWGMGGLYYHMKLVQHWLNWDSAGWAGFVTLVFGLVWGSYAQRLAD